MISPKKQTIPARNRDLRVWVHRQRIRLAGCYLLWLGALTIGVLSYNRGHEFHPLVGWKLALWLGGGAAVGFLLLRVWRLFSDRTYCGTVLRTGLSHGYSRDEFRLNTALVVRDEATGRRRRVRFEQKEGFYLLYRAGTRICHLSGLPYPIPDPETLQNTTEPAANRTDDRSGGVLCALCGHVNPRGVEICASCAHSLIRPEDLFGAQADEEEL